MLETIGILAETAAHAFAANTGFYLGEPGVLGVSALCVSIAASLAMLTALFEAIRATGLLLRAGLVRCGVPVEKIGVAFFGGSGNDGEAK